MEGILIKIIKLISVLIAALSVFSFKTSALSDTSASSVLINADTLEIIYSNKPYVKRSMASTTKIMTGILLAESGRLDEDIECTSAMVTVEGSAMGLKAGDIISGRDLLYGLMLMSGNDAANVAAYFLAGSTENFAIIMNEKAKMLGLNDTNFVTPSGLDAEEHYTTAFDLAKLTAYALMNDEFRKACSSYTAKVYFGNPKIRYTIKNHNRLLNEYEGCIGVKTGFTKKSGRCLVSAAERDGKRIIAVTLNDPNDWRDHKSMLDYGFVSLKPISFGDDPQKIKVIGGESDFVEIDFQDIDICSTENNKSNFKFELDIPDYLVAPVIEGQKIGEAVLKYGDYVVRKCDVTPVCNVGRRSVQEKSGGEKIKDFLIKMLKSF